MKELADRIENANKQIQNILVELERTTNRKVISMKLHSVEHYEGNGITFDKRWVEIAMSTAPGEGWDKRW